MHPFTSFLNTLPPLTLLGEKKKKKTYFHVASESISVKFLAELLLLFVVKVALVLHYPFNEDVTRQYGHLRPLVNVGGEVAKVKVAE